MAEFVAADRSIGGAAKSSGSERGLLLINGQSAPYCLLLRPEPPRRRGPLDLAIETRFELNGKIGLHWAAG
jgi:hypothetical protein